PTLALEPHPEVTSDHVASAKGFLDVLDRIHGWMRVRVQEPKDIATGGAGARVHLQTAATRSVDHARTTLQGNRHRGVLAIPIRDNYLDRSAHSGHDVQGLTQRVCLVQGRDDDREHCRSCMLPGHSITTDPFPILL